MNTFLWFSVGIGNDVKEGVRFFVGKEEILDEGAFFKFEFFCHFLHVENWIMLVKLVSNLEFIKI